jgi:hypothetical protein
MTASLYSYYTKYILTFLFQAGYAHNCESKCPKLAGYKIFLSIFEHKRFQHVQDQQFIYFLCMLSPTPVRWTLKTISKLRNPHYLLSTRCTARQLGWFERMVFTVYPYYKTAPIRTQRLGNNTLTFSVPGYRFLEAEYLRPGERYTKHALQINTTCRFQLFLKPGKKLSLYEQRNFLRALNVPLQNFEK